MTTFLIKLFGPNFKVRLTGIITTITGALTALAALPYTLGDVAMWIPPDLKPGFIKVCGTAALISHILNVFFSKATNVSGNAAQGYAIAKGNDQITTVESSSPDLTVTSLPVKMDQPEPPTQPAA